MNLWEGNVFTIVCPSAEGMDISGTGPFSVADRRGRLPPLRAKNFSISCSFSEILAKSCWRLLIRGILDSSLLLGAVGTLCPGGRYVRG